jgi:hypothetical protein
MSLLSDPREGSSALLGAGGRVKTARLETRGTPRHQYFNARSVMIFPACFGAVLWAILFLEMGKIAVNVGCSPLSGDEPMVTIK